MARFNKAGLKRFLRYSVVGVGTFLFDLVLLFFFIDFLSIHYLLATALAFLIAVSINFIISRNVIFKKTERNNLHSYIYFVSFATLSLFLITGMMYLFVTVLEAHYVISRILIASGVGMLTYLLHLSVTFKVTGKH